MSEAKSSKSEKLAPLSALPKFNRRLIKPSSSEYEKPELGKMREPQNTVEKTVVDAPGSASPPGDRKKRESKQNSLLDSMYNLKIADKPATTVVTNDNGGKPGAVRSNLESDFNHKVAQLHRPPKFKQIVKSTSKDTKKSDSNSEATKTREWLDKILDESAPNETENPKLDDEKDIPELKVPGLVPLLMPHQVVGVKFLSRREKSSKYAKGGLLADLMGLGKTVQSIALILYKPPPTDLKADRGSRVTLVVAPLTVMDQWKSEINQMAPSLRVMTHQGNKRVTDSKVFSDFDVVVTTYDIVRSEYSKTERAQTALFSTPFYRIIADEAHVFRNENTRVSQAMQALQTLRSRWVLTGTPIHNSVTDLFSLLRFIGIEKEFSQDDPELKKMLKTVMLRRTQKVLKGAVPAIEMEKRPITLSKDETSIYSRFDNAMRSGGGVSLLTSMRLACNGIISTIGLKKESYFERENPKALGSTESDVFENPKGQIDEGDALAAMLGNMKLHQTNNGKEDEFWGSQNSKIQAIRDILSKNRQRKTVVFSSFVTMLHALRPMLDHEGLSHSMYIGSMTASQRQSVLEKFRDEKPGTTTVLLCSLHATAVGLNLTSASQVILTEPWWNPQISDQAIKRVHRLGQKHVVNCIELFAKDTLEERILMIQDLKRKDAKDLLHPNETMTKEERHFMLYGDTERPMS